MNKPRLVRAIPLAAVGAAVVVAAAIMSGGYALASSNNHAPTVHTALGDVDALRYLVGTNVLVPANSAGSNATECPIGMYPVGGGPSSSNAQWTLQWSDPDRSTPTAAHPDEWTVGLFNNSSSAQNLKVFVVCATASKVTGNY